MSGRWALPGRVPMGRPGLGCPCRGVVGQPGRQASRAPSDGQVLSPCRPSASEWCPVCTVRLPHIELPSSSLPLLAGSAAQGVLATE